MTTLLEEDIRTLVTDPLDTIVGLTGDSHYHVFSDWITLSLASFVGDEEAYQQPIERYREIGCDEATVRGVLHGHAEALGGLVVAMQESDEDVLGGVYEFYGLTSEHFAQYFTPGSLSRAMAAMNIPDTGDLRAATPADPLIIGDISGCGSGRLIVDAARRLRSVAPEAPALYFGYDKDPVCVKMCVVNFLLNSMTGYVLLGDALPLEIHRAWAIDPQHLLDESYPVYELSERERRAVLVRFFGVSPSQSDDGELNVAKGAESGQTHTPYQNQETSESEPDFPTNQQFSSSADTGDDPDVDVDVGQSDLEEFVKS